MRYYEHEYFDRKTGEKRYDGWLGETEAAVRRSFNIHPDEKVYPRQWATVVIEQHGSEQFFLVTPPMGAMNKSAYRVDSFHPNFEFVVYAMADGSAFVYGKMEERPS